MYIFNEKNNYQIQVTQDNTPSIENRTQQDLISSVRRQGTPRQSKVRFVKDPLENECHFEQPNPFLFNEQLKHSFRLFGIENCLELSQRVQSCNWSDSQNRSIQTISKWKSISNLVEIKIINQNVYVVVKLFADDLLQCKIKVQERYNKIKQLIQQKMKSKNKNDSLRDVQMFKHLFDTLQPIIDQISFNCIVHVKRI
ncbi:unnamed protein product (macronuclear) [Paramecium tetraurelia]|uniref:Uncharacterized protein n=1 Tax=Paramecium tetraurelia TaxID=5888 RepID=A0C2Y0_PARTE|nr:uncharacterized protein GSPATT00034625001 [Paramecium tetraurelia]CAK65147.1 unnamed protein product [Paramecium tetraurelia]|eukprot:XP_001432544.1 hypothetical protein (macronuclear) [Paramecium tetraurelia strain d4-2]